MEPAPRQINNTLNTIRIAMTTSGVQHLQRSPDEPIVFLFFFLILISFFLAVEKSMFTN